MIPLRTAFADDYDRLQALRKTDPIFAEICRDYETLLIEAKQLASASQDGGRHAQDLEDSLSGLRDELARMLRKASTRMQSQEI